MGYKHSSSFPQDVSRPVCARRGGSDIVLPVAAVRRRRAEQPRGARAHRRRRPRRRAAGRLPGTAQGQSVATCDPFQDRARGRPARRTALRRASGPGHLQGLQGLQRFPRDCSPATTSTPWSSPRPTTGTCRRPGGRAGGQGRLRREAAGASASSRTRRCARRSTSTARCSSTARSSARSTRTAPSPASWSATATSGELKAVHVVAPNGARGGNATPQPVPEGLDYDLWLGRRR